MIYYSGFLLKELMFILSTEDYLNKIEIFELNPNFKKIMLSKEEYKKAQILKNVLTSNLSLFDIIHVLLANKTKSILVTRDRELIEFSKKMNIEAKKPEEIL